MSSTPRRLSWDILRVVLVLLVVLYHATWIGPHVYRDLIPRNLFFAHQVGASLLLVLSAFFVAASLRPGGAATASRGAAARWWWSRIARLVPPFVVATVVAWWVLRHLAPPGWFLPTRHDLLWNLLMLWNVNGAWHVDYVDGSHWTVPVQLLVFCLAALLARTRIVRGVPLRVVLWAAVLGGLALWPVEQAHLGTVVESLYNGVAVHRWHLVVAGIVVWMLGARRLGRRHGAALLALCVLAHAVQTSFDEGAGGRATDLVADAGVGLGLLVLLAAACGPDWRRGVPAPVARAVSWLAGISYGVFLVHQTVGYVVMVRLQELGVGPTLQTGAMVAVGVLGGWALTGAVERPATALLLDAWDRTWDRAGVAYARADTPTTSGFSSADPDPEPDPEPAGTGWSVSRS